MVDMIYGMRHTPSLLLMVLLTILVVIIPTHHTNGGSSMVMAVSTCNCTCPVGEYTTDCSLGTCTPCTVGNR